MIIRSTVLTALMGLFLFPVQAVAQIALGDPCTNIGETRISSDQTDILTCLKSDKNLGAVQGNLFWKATGAAGVPTIECTSAYINPNPLRVSIPPGGDPNALVGYGNATAWGGRCLNNYVMTGCTTGTPSWPTRKSGTFKDASNNTVPISYLDLQWGASDYSISAWLNSSDQSCTSDDAGWRTKGEMDIMCCHLVSK